MKTIFFVCAIFLGAGASGCRNQGDVPYGGLHVQAITAHALSISAAVGTQTSTKQGDVEKVVSPVSDNKSGESPQ
jgi:hypothetical protein